MGIPDFVTWYREHGTSFIWHGRKLEAPVRQNVKVPMRGANATAGLDRPSTKDMHAGQGRGDQVNSLYGLLRNNLHGPLYLYSRTLG